MWLDEVKEVLSEAGLDPADRNIAGHLWNYDRPPFVHLPQPPSS